MSLEKIIANNRKNFERWDNFFGEYLYAQYHCHEISNEENERIFFQANQLLIEIAENFFSYGKFKDKWDTSKCSLHVFGQHLYLKSEKLGVDFYWGLEKSCFYLESYIINDENLRFMTDDFWQDLLNLKALGDFDFVNADHLSAEEKPFFENKTSAVFRMIRKFMLFQTKKMNGSNHQQPKYMDMGQLVLKWDMNDTNWETLVEKAVVAFKIMYNLNYRLWKIDDLENKKKSKGLNV